MTAYTPFNKLLLPGGQRTRGGGRYGGYIGEEEEGKEVEEGQGGECGVDELWSDLPEGKCLGNESWQHEN